VQVLDRRQFLIFLAQSLASLAALSACNSETAATPSKFKGAMLDRFEVGTDRVEVIALPRAQRSPRGRPRSRRERDRTGQGEGQARSHHSPARRRASDRVVIRRRGSVGEMVVDRWLTVNLREPRLQRLGRGLGEDEFGEG
jgi:hypothetical protein